MDYRVRPGEMQEDQVTAMLERYSSEVAHQLIYGCGDCVHYRIHDFEESAEASRCAVRRTMGCAVFDSGFVQQISEATWVGQGWLVLL